MFDLKTLRIKKGVRQVELAAEAGTTVQYIWMIENGERKPSVKVAKRIAKALGFDWTLFFE